MQCSYSKMVYLSLLYSSHYTPTYKLAKFVVPILISLTGNEYTVKDSFAFVEDIVEKDSEIFMESQNVDFRRC